MPKSIYTRHLGKGRRIEIFECADGTHTAAAYDRRGWGGVGFARSDMGVYSFGDMHIPSWARRALEAVL